MHAFSAHEADGGDGCADDLRRGRSARGGVICKGNDPAYYLLAGECYAAISDNQEARISAMRDEDPAPGSDRVGAQSEPGSPGLIDLPQSTAGKFSSTL